jgi:hypothetical protein
VHIVVFRILLYFHSTSACGKLYDCRRSLVIELKLVYELAFSCKTIVISRNPTQRDTHPRKVTVALISFVGRLKRL